MLVWIWVAGALVGLGVGIPLINPTMRSFAAAADAYDATINEGGDQEQAAQAGWNAGRGGAHAWAMFIGMVLLLALGFVSAFKLITIWLG